MGADIEDALSEAVSVWASLFEAFCHEKKRAGKDGLAKTSVGTVHVSAHVKVTI